MVHDYVRTIFEPHLNLVGLSVEEFASMTEVEKVKVLNRITELMVDDDIKDWI